MSLKHELGLRKPIKLLPHEAVLNIYFTASRLKKRADAFFRRYGLTDVQFNAMMLLCHQKGPQGGLSQAELSDMMLVNRANITSLVDRMEKAGLVARTPAADRRYNIVKLTSRGRKLLERVQPAYVRQVKETMAVLDPPQQKSLIRTLEKIRQQLSE